MTNQSKRTAASIIEHFAVPGQYLDERPYGNGHLHDTYLVRVTQRNIPTSWILQRINHYAFKDPPALMENIVRITEHIRAKLEQRYAGEELERRVLRVVRTEEDGFYHRDGEGNYWRVYGFITATCSHDIIRSPQLLFEVSRMFGEFLDLLSDLPGPPLHESIPDFHNGERRFAAFHDAVMQDSHNRAKGVEDLISFTANREPLFNVVPKLLLEGKIPLRPTHNDTKVNNVLVDKETGQGVCVIDLDTAMSGVSLYDFGDLVRTTLSTKAEDEQDLSGVTADVERFETILKGFLYGAGDSLSSNEKGFLYFSTILMPLIIGMRFLTDYLQGDPYFKTHRPQHNLDRCRRQYKLIDVLSENEDQIRRVIEKYG